MKDLNIIQRQILKRLQYFPSARFVDLRPDEDTENNQLTYHLQQLIKYELVIHKNGRYLLTTKGKEVSTRFGADASRETGQKQYVKVIAVREVNRQKEVLAYTRYKHPFFGHQGDPELILIQHFLVVDADTEELLEDKYMCVFRVQEPSGELVSNKEGNFEWVPIDNIANYFKKPFSSLEEVQSEIQAATRSSSSVKIVESTIMTSEY